MLSKDLLYYNGFGGFTKNQDEYVIKTSEKSTMVPWSHIIANESFGTLVTSSGGGYTWHGNSRENKLTAWSNDQVYDEQSEEFFVKNLNDNKIISCTPRNNLFDFEIHFGFGYAKFIFENNDIKMELLEFVPLEKSEKIFCLEIENKTSEISNYEISFIANPVLGVCKEFTSKHLKFVETMHGYALRNTYRDIYKNDNVFFELNSFVSETIKKIIFDENNLNKSKICLSTKVELLPSEKKKVIGKIFVCASEECMNEYETTQKEFEKVKAYWHELTNKIKVYSPIDSFNIMMNGWLLYQTLACRMWAKTSFYQAGGAFGFRDQLQDSLMFLNINPAITKKQILYHAEHQFKEGDVLHWWHAEKNNGTRTRFTDDLLWLPYTICKYINATNDYAILDEKISFAEGRELSNDEDEIYIETTKSDERASLYEHAKLAIEKSFSFGEHGLPKIGSGDWNDGMNNIKGESVWLGFFLYKILIDFSEICVKKNDEETKISYNAIAEELKKNLNAKGWDGKWFRRAFFDDGTMVGSESLSECKIDGITQSFSVISGAGEKEKCIEAMKNLDKFLVDRENQIIKLLTPPFSKCEKNPGYIKSYIPGVRENGGQYTHGAVWAIIATSLLGNENLAFEYFRFLNPIEHARTLDAALKYKVEPYVVAADIYSNPSMLGRGGWTWYTGSSAWLYVAGLEYILGIKKKGEHLEITPCISSDWENCTVLYKYKNATYTINYYNYNRKENSRTKIYFDNEEFVSNLIPLLSEGEHKVDYLFS